MQEEELKTQKKKLIEMLGVYFEQEKSIAPLAARIQAMLILNGERGTTFEQLVSGLEASKSTICTHLNTLVGQQSVMYFTKCGDRKRYYSMAPGYVSRKIDSLRNQWQEEEALQKKILAYKNAYNTIHMGPPLTTTIHENALDFFEQAMHFLTQMASRYQTKEQLHNSEI